MTGTEMKDYIVRAFRRDDKTTELFEALTDTVMDIKKRLPMKDFEAEVAVTGITTLGEYKLTFPANTGHLISDLRVFDTDTGTVLRKVEKSEYDMLEPYPDDTNALTGIPKYYCVYGGYIYLTPIPDKITYTYKASYTTETATAIVAGTANVPFSTNYRELLKYGTLRRLYTDLGSDEDALKWGTMYEGEMYRVQDVERENRKSYKVVQFLDI